MNYEFFAHARAGLANNIVNTRDNRGEVTLRVVVNGFEQQKSFKLLGRDDITGFSQEKILRRVPDDGANVFAPYNLAFVEFYEEDFPWRFSPFKADTDTQKLKPWLFLVALKKGEFKILEGTDASDPTLRYLEFENVKDKIDTLQDEIHLWAHVQSANPGNQTEEDPDGTISRILCPRKLEPNTAYEAFLIPTYESPETDKHLIFHSWRFQTNNEPDFEYLASLLEPRTMPVEFGRRALNSDEIGYDLELPALARYLPMDGALTSFSVKPALHPVLAREQEKVHKLVAGEVNKGLVDRDMDPVVSPWAYGHKHIQYDRNINPDEKIDQPWIHELNSTPGLRAAAGLGAQVIRTNQDKYMERAWAQLESLDLVARSIHRTEAAMVISRRLYEKHLHPLADDVQALIGVTRPLLKKVKADNNKTIDSMLSESLANFKGSQILRSAGGLEERVKGRDTILDIRGEKEHQTIQLPDGESHNIEIIITDKETGVPVKGAVVFYRMSVRGLFEESNPADQTGKCLINSDSLPISGMFWYVVAKNYCSEKFYFTPSRNKPSTLLKVSLEKIPEQDLDSLISGWVYHVSNGRKLQLSGVTIKVYKMHRNPDNGTYTGIAVTTTNTNNAGNFWVKYFLVNPGDKIKLVFEINGYQTQELIVPWRDTSLEVRMIPDLDMNQIKQQILQQVHPVRNHKQRLTNLFKSTSIQGWFDPELTDEETLLAPIAYPVFDDAMYEKVKELGTDYLVPNLKLMPNNCITLLNTNRSFVEAFLVGLNVEMGRELRWREFPTDERGSYFRQFWDVRGLMYNPAVDAQEFKDIKPVHEWEENGGDNIGTHHPRNNSEPLVLAIRGGLIQAFPNAMIYAVKAVEYTEPGEGGIEIPLEDVTGNVWPKRLTLGSVIVSPIFGGKIEPDITLKGFNLTYEDVLGKADSGEWGYFFVIKEVAGELRFGLDVPPPPQTDVPPTPPQTVEKWSDLSWRNINNLETNSSFLTDVNKQTSLVHLARTFNREGWGANSAKMAQIFSQKPVMIAIHAREMLKDINNTQ